MLEINVNSRIKKDIYLDQGFIQILFSILYEMDLTNKIDIYNITNRWIQIISSTSKNIYLFYCSSKDEEITKRLLERDGDSIIEKKEKNKKDLKIYKRIFEHILCFLINHKEKYPNIYFKEVDLNDYNNELFKF